MFRIYYHLYLGASWREVWALHWPHLESFAGSGLLEKLVVCVYGREVGEFPRSKGSNVEIRVFSQTLNNINEFDTLRAMALDAADPAQKFTYCAYMHSKGSSSLRLNAAVAEWSSFLARALLGALPAFARVVAMGYNSLGSNLAFGVFEDFGPPRLHYSGNFWCATRELIVSAPDIRLGERFFSIRHNAEWWLDGAAAFSPYNVFSTGIDHYSAQLGAVDWERLEYRFGGIGSNDLTAEHAMRRISFLRKMIVTATGRQGVRHLVSAMLLRAVPYNRWHRLFNVLDIIMRRLGSRKSVYFYCPES